MYARFLAGPESIAKGRRSDSATSNDALAAKQAEAAAMAEANPYAAFSGISEAGLQSSVFQAPVCPRGLLQPSKVWKWSKSGGGDSKMHLRLLKHELLCESHLPCITQLSLSADAVIVVCAAGTRDGAKAVCQVGAGHTRRERQRHVQRPDAC
jgi:hypothetical protein